MVFLGKIYGETVDFLADTGMSNSFVPREPRAGFVTPNGRL